MGFEPTDNGLDPALVDTSLSHSEVFNMSKKGKRYTVEFRYQIVQLVRAGRAIPELSKEFGVSIWSIRNWVKQAARDAGTGDQGLTSLEREELTRLKHEVRQLRQEREILSKAAAWFARENIEIPKRSSDSCERAIEVRYISDRQDPCDPPTLERGVRIADDPCGALR